MQCVQDLDTYSIRKTYVTRLCESTESRTNDYIPAAFAFYSPLDIFDNVVCDNGTYSEGISRNFGNDFNDYVHDVLSSPLARTN